MGNPSESRENGSIVQMDTRLNRIQRLIPVESASVPALGLLAIAFLYLAQAEYLPNQGQYDPKIAAATVVFDVAMAGLGVASAFGALKTGTQAVEHIRERQSILTQAKEQGLKVAGIIFKRVKSPADQIR